MKKVSRLAAVLLCFSLLSGCASQTAQPSPSAAVTPSESAAPSTAIGLRTLTDAAGRQVEIPQEVKSIVCVNVCTLRFTTYMGAADLVVGVEQNEVEQRISKPFNYFNHDLFSTLPVMGDNGKTYDEEIVKIGPDVIMANTDKESADALQAKTGIPVVVVPLSEGMMDESVFEMLRVMGEVYGLEDRAKELGDYITSLEADLKARTESIPDSEKPSVYVGGVSFKGAHGFEGTEAGYAPFAALGANNLADQTGQAGAFSIDPEQVLQWDPDVIFLDFNGMELINEDYAKNPDFYNGLSAVKNGRVYSQISFRSSATNTELALADAYYAGKVLYPDAFADVDPAEKFNEIFEMFLGVKDAYSVYQAKGYEFREMSLGE